MQSGALCPQTVRDLRAVIFALGWITEI